MKGIDDFGFTEEQKIYIRSIMERRRQRTHKSFFERYGVSSLRELDDLFALTTAWMKPSYVHPYDESEAFRAIIREVFARMHLKTLKQTNEYVALLRELELILTGGNAYAIYKTIQVLKYCKSRNEPFLLGGSLASLFLFYYLGFAKLNPLVYGIRCETLLGCLESTKKVNYFWIKTRPGFEKDLQKKVIERFDGSDVYRQVDSKGKAIPFKIHLLPAGTDVSKAALDVKETDYPVLEKPYDFEEGICFRITSENMLQEAKDALDLKPGLDYRDGLEPIAKALAMGNYSVLGLGNGRNYAFTKPEKWTIGDLISLYSSAFGFARKDEIIAPFFDRDSVMNYAYDHGTKNIRDSYELMEKARKGHYKPGDMGIVLNEAEAKKLANCAYLVSRSFSAENVYLRLLLAAAM